MSAKAIPNDSGRGIALSDFLSGETKSAANTMCLSEHFVEHDGKAAKKTALKAIAAETAVLL